MRFTVRADQEAEVICRATTFAWLDEDVIEIVPIAGLQRLTSSAKKVVETWAATELNATVTWTGTHGTVAEFTPNYESSAA